MSPLPPSVIGVEIPTVIFFEIFASPWILREGTSIPSGENDVSLFVNRTGPSNLLTTVLFFPPFTIILLSTLTSLEWWMFAGKLSTPATVGIGPSKISSLE